MYTIKILKVQFNILYVSGQQPYVTQLHYPHYNEYVTHIHCSNFFRPDERIEIPMIYSSITIKNMVDVSSFANVVSVEEF